MRDHEIYNLMKVCGFTIAYNALRFGYCIEASLRSMLPLQADEVFHEKDYPLVRQTMERHRNNSGDAIRLRYHHYYGSFQTIRATP